MEYAGFVVLLLLLGEWMLELTWAGAYYRRGVAVYRGTTSVAAPTGVELYVAEPGFWRGVSHLVCRRLSFRLVLFRESVFTRLIGIHGRIMEQPDGRHHIVVYTALWPHLSWMGACAVLLADRQYLGGAVAVGVAAGWTLLQRLRSDRIRRAIEEAA